jgi:hypothetical protein
MDPQPGSPDPRSDRRLVAVFPDQSRAEAAEASLRSQGVGTVIVGDPDDYVASLRGEMRGEVSHGVVSSAPFVATRTGVRSFASIAGIGVVVALVLAVPLAFIDYGPPWWARYLIMVAIIAFLGFVIALVLGPGMGVNRPAEQMAAERGVTLQVLPSTSAAREALAALHPIRIDEVGADGTPIAVVDPGEGEGDGAPTTGLVANLGTDDYSPPTPATD